MSSHHQPVRWGILATGRIAGVFAKAVSEVPLQGSVVAVGSRSLESAGRFAADHLIAKAHGSYEALLADPQVEAVYIGTPHTEHREWSLKAIAAGKHVLCEKPAAMSASDAEEMIKAAKSRGLLWMEAFMYRSHPQTKRIVDFIRRGTLGKVGLVQASFSFRRDYDPSMRLWDAKLGGGGIMDVGCYPVSLARLVAGANIGADYADPVRVNGVGVVHGPSGVDEVAAATLQFSDGLIAQVSCGISLFQDNRARIYGSEAWLEVESPFVIERWGVPPKMWLCRWGQEKEDVSVPIERDLYTYEIEDFASALRGGQGEVPDLIGVEIADFASALRGGQGEVPAMRHGDTLGNLDVLETWLQQVLRR